MDRQKHIFEKLVFGPFPSNLANIIYGSRILPGDALYVNGNYKIQEPNNMFPDDPRDHFEHDVILLVVHCGERSGRRKILNKDVLSIEIKTGVEDILKSSVEQYLGATRMFFIAAPGDKLPHVLNKYRSHPRRMFIGVIDSDSGRIVVLPQFQEYQKDRRNRLLSHCYTSEHRFPFCVGDVEPYSVHRIAEKGTDEPVFVDAGGFRVNSAYLDLFRR